VERAPFDLLGFFTSVLLNPAVLEVAKTWSAEEQAAVVKLCAASLALPAQPLQLEVPGWCEQQRLCCLLAASDYLQSGLEMHEQRTGCSMLRRTAKLCKRLVAALPQLAGSGGGTSHCSSSNGSASDRDSDRNRDSDRSGDGIGGIGGGAGSAADPTMRPRLLLEAMSLLGQLLSAASKVATFEAVLPQLLATLQ